MEREQDPGSAGPDAAGNSRRFHGLSPWEELGVMRELGSTHSFEGIGEEGASVLIATRVQEPGEVVQDPIPPVAGEGV